MNDIMKTVFALFLIGATALIGCQDPAPAPATPAAQTAPAPANPHFASETIHIGVIASDLEASLRFYTEAIGM